ncbi:MAG: hypothetical protein OEY88_03250 [Candidatus Bathyarchaeota archaeon]|nr:hypothetical protein [Candidatus Bathyarchaeota archaeon]
MTSLTKVYRRKTKKELNYARTEDIFEELRVLEKQKGWTIFENLKVLKDRGADSFSFTKDTPYEYFYGRITEEVVILRLKTKKGETEFRLPLAELL